MRGKPERDEPAERDAVASSGGWEVRHLLARRVPRPSRRVVPALGAQARFNANAGDGFLARVANAARARQSSGGSDKPR
jgi:hypothetical protein